MNLSPAQINQTTLNKRAKSISLSHTYLPTHDLSIDQSSSIVTMSVGSMLTFNIADGYVEGLVRGFRSGILTTADYSNLVQCDALEGLAPSLSISPSTSTCAR